MNIYINVYKEQKVADYYWTESHTTETDAVEDILHGKSGADYVTTVRIDPKTGEVKPWPLHQEVCLAKFDDGQTDECTCGMHTLHPAEPDVGIRESYLE